jgi:hypothetical protein
MTLAMAMILFGIALIYAGITGHSPWALIAGGRLERSQAPQAVTR